jgi:CRP-like cAMP-binding protein
MVANIDEPLTVASALGDLLPHASGRSVHHLVTTATLVAHRAEAEIVAGSAMGPPFLIVLSGIVARMARGPDGHEVAYGLLVPGMAGGSMGLSPDPSPVLSLVSWTDAEVATWSRDTVRAMAHGDAGLALDLADIALELATVLASGIEDLMSVPAVERLARVLIRYESIAFDAHQPVLRRHHLTSLIGTSREMMERCIRTLEERRILVRTGNAGLLLLDRPALERFAA